MRPRRAYAFSDFSGLLESRTSLSAVRAGILLTPEVITYAATDTGGDDIPTPDPEPDPGPFPGDDPPIAYPPLPPSGPVGPG
jgi:hypothetical protein